MAVILTLFHLAAETFRHRKKVFALSLLITLIPMVLMVYRLPRVYQSSALFNFHSDFSKIPASSEFFSEIYDPNELRAVKEAILLGVLADEFLFSLAEKYLGEPSTHQEWIVQGLRKDIRFVPLSRTTYQLVVRQRTPEDTQNIAWDVIRRLEESLRTDRLDRMQSVYDSITQQLNELTIEGSDKNIDLNLHATRLQIENEIQQLQAQYTSEHPRLIRLRAQLSSLRSIRKDASSDAFMRGQMENWASLRGVLITRQALLQVAIRMEENRTVSHIKIVKEPDLPQWPVEPKRAVLLVSAGITSLVIAFVVAGTISTVRDLHGLFPKLRAEWQQFRQRILKSRASLPNRDS